ncbi:hypothetical protein HK096_004945 [Nowakowskiella sp. JEL0078]|nr:hypothetical protein HK096_004945 [Nowakowskiella sp. JEL0078]
MLSDTIESKLELLEAQFFQWKADLENKTLKLEKKLDAEIHHREQLQREIAFLREEKSTQSIKLSDTRELIQSKITGGAWDGMKLCSTKSFRQSTELPKRLPIMAQLFEAGIPGCKISNLLPVDIEPISIELSRTTMLRFLDLSENGIDADGAELIASFLATNSTLRVLDLRDNKIMPEGAQAIAKAVKETVSLEVLILDINFIGSAGAQALAEALEDNTSMRVLSVGHNGIDPQGGEAFGKMLRKNNTLEALILMFNSDIGSGGFAVARALEVNNSLRYLSMFQCHILNEGANEFLSSLQINKTLEVIFLGNNEISMAIKNKIRSIRSSLTISD